MYYFRIYTWCPHSSVRTLTNVNCSTLADPNWLWLCPNHSRSDVPPGKRYWRPKDTPLLSLNHYEQLPWRNSCQRSPACSPLGYQRTPPATWLSLDVTRNLESYLLIMVEEKRPLKRKFKIQSSTLTAVPFHLFVYLTFYVSCCTWNHRRGMKYRPRSCSSKRETDSVRIEQTLIPDSPNVWLWLDWSNGSIQCSEFSKRGLRISVSRPRLWSVGVNFSEATSWWCLTWEVDKLGMKTDSIALVWKEHDTSCWNFRGILLARSWF